MQIYTALRKGKKSRAEVVAPPEGPIYGNFTV